MFNFITKIIVSIFTIASINAFALEAKPAATSAAKAISKVDLSTSTFTWTGTKKIGGNHYGPIQLKSADIMTKNGKVVNGGFVMDMDSMTSTDMKGNPKYNDLMGHLKASKFFNVKAHPEAKLIITNLKNNIAKGILTIKNISHPIQVPFTQVGNTFSGKMTFDRTKYNITYGSEDFFKKLVEKKIINNDVTIDFVVNLL